jgi:hypothetical protein
MKYIYPLLFGLGIALPSFAGISENDRKDSTNTTTKIPSVEKRKPWFESFSIRGYVQVRYNRLLETNAKLKCEQCDRSWGEQGGFFMRRARVIISGNIHDRVYIYIQPDFASSASSSSLHFAQIRDAYFDVALDAKREFRFRIGQSKIPYGFENMQSSQNRLPLDRNDALNSALSNERDMGLMFYWAPTKVRSLFASLVNDGLKGSGDYGVIGVGVFNGQSANRPEANNTPHVVARVSYPFALNNKQIIEAGVQAYQGKFVVTSDLRTAGVGGPADFQFTDERIAGTFVLYPKPFGIQAEYTVGRGPEYNKNTQRIETQALHGGYATVSYLIRKPNQTYIPFVRAQQYSGGKKFELDARSYRIKELELGFEWQPNRFFELVAMYTLSERRFEDHRTPNNLQKGRLLRLQAQLNF